MQILNGAGAQIHGVSHAAEYGGIDGIFQVIGAVS